MPKQGTNDLFRLIHSMDGAEKSYFKKFAKRHVIGDENKYVRLFDAIEVQKEYDEQKLLKEEKYVRQLPYLKNYLFNLIMQSLNNYHSQSSADSILRHQISQIEILQRKGLFDVAGKQIRKAKNFARELELHHHNVQLNNLEYKIAWRQFNYEGLEKIMKEEKEHLFHQEKSKSLRDLLYRLIVRYNKTGTSRSKKDFEEIEKLIKHPLLKQSPDELPFEARKTFFHINFVYFISKGDYENAYTYAKKKINLFLSHPNRKKYNADAYLSSLNDLFNTLYELKRYDEMKKYLDDLSRFQPEIKTIDEKVKAFHYSGVHHLNFYNNTGRFDEGAKKSKNILNELSYYETKLNSLQKCILHTNMAIAFFGNEEYKTCLKLLNKISIYTKSKTRADLESFLKIFYVLVHYEIHNEDLLPYLAKSNYRTLFRQKRLFRFETLMLKFFERILPKINMTDKKELRKAFQILKTEVEKLSSDLHEKNILDDFDFISWIESKIENKSFAETVKKKK
ncbi:MAG: hypothetical protein HY063_12480 [Bacteroidetes bacterium]|nr:hypothetical protein [Bacteroidota bacterium]